MIYGILPMHLLSRILTIFGIPIYFFPSSFISQDRSNEFTTIITLLKSVVEPGSGPLRLHVNANDCVLIDGEQLTPAKPSYSRLREFLSTHDDTMFNNEGTVSVPTIESVDKSIILPEWRRAKIGTECAGPNEDIGTAIVSLIFGLTQGDSDMFPMVIFDHFVVHEKLSAQYALNFLYALLVSVQGEKNVLSMISDDFYRNSLITGVLRNIDFFAQDLSNDIQYVDVLRVTMFERILHYVTTVHDANIKFEEYHFYNSAAIPMMYHPYSQIEFREGNFMEFPSRYFSAIDHVSAFLKDNTRHPRGYRRQDRFNGTRPVLIRLWLLRIVQSVARQTNESAELSVAPDYSHPMLQSLCVGNDSTPLLDACPWRYVCDYPWESIDNICTEIEATFSP